MLPQPFPEPVESDYIEFSLRVFRPGIRAWHTAVLSVVVLALLSLASQAPGAMSVGLPRLDSMQLLLIGVAVCARTVLCTLAWRPQFLRIYPKVALPLTLVGHVCINAIFAAQIFGPHPAYIAAITVCAFGAGFLTGLKFQQSLLVNGAVLCLLIVSAWRQPLPAALVTSVILHILFAIFMAGVVAIALERSVRALYLENRRVGEMAASDGLTGLKNRRAFDEHLRRVWQLAIRDKRGVGVLLIDVDFFKSFNDTMGHQAGDAALQSIASVVATTVRRPLDMSARYGGEELAVILYDVTRDYVADVAEVVQRKVEALGIRHPRSIVAPVVTVSTGVAYLRPTAERSPQGAILLADRGLYAAKNAGRNQATMLDRDVDAGATGVFASSEAPVAKVLSG
jgi:diguanylate cyclase (GGDEF)-like protein